MRRPTLTTGAADPATFQIFHRVLYVPACATVRRVHIFQKWSLRARLQAPLVYLHRMLNPMAAPKSTRRARFERAQAHSFQLTERDVEIIREVAAHRFLRSTHISRLLQGSHKKIVERLTALFHAGYLDRPRSQLDYHVRAGGSAPFVYGLGNRGADLLAERDDAEGAAIDWMRKNDKAGRQFLLHTLEIADFRVALRAACRAHAEIGLRQPGELLDWLPEDTKKDRNPWSMRVRVHHNGTVHELGLVPDYLFALMLPDGRRRPFLVECDRGTMPVERSSLSQTSMLRKFLAYEGARQQGLHTERFGWLNFRVLIITRSSDRLVTMRTLVESLPALKASPLFLFANQADLVDSDVLAYPWSNPSGRPHALI